MIFNIERILKIEILKGNETCSLRKLSNDLNIKKFTIASFLKKYRRTDTTLDQKSSGRRKKLNTTGIRTKI